MAKRCGPNRTICGMSQGIYNPFFQGGAPWYGSGGTSDGNTSQNTNALGQQAFLIIGDSTAAGQNNVVKGVGPTPTAGTSYYYRRSTNTVIQIGATDLALAANPPSDGSPWPQFAISYNATSGKKACVISTGVGGSTFSPNGDNTNWSTTGSFYSLAVTDANNCMAVLGVTKLRGIYISCGTNDIGAATALSTVESDINSLITRLQTDFPGVDIVMMQVGLHVATQSQRRAAITQYIKNAAINNSNVYLLGGLAALLAAGNMTFGNVHPHQPGNNDLGKQYARWVTNYRLSKWVRSIVSSCTDDLSAARITLISNLIDNNFAEYMNHDCFYLLKNTTIGNAFMDWTFLNCPRNFGATFTANSHVQFVSGSSQYFTTGYLPLYSAYKSTPSDYFAAVKVKTATTPSGTVGCLIGARNAGNTIFNTLRQTATPSILYMNNDGTFTVTTGDTVFLNDTEHMTGRNGTSKFYYKNGAQVATVVQAVISGISDSELAVAAQSDAGTPSSFWSGQAEAVRIGKFTGVTHSGWYTAMETLLDNW